MTSMALSGTFQDFGKSADRHVSRGRPKLAFARTVLGQLLDGVASYFVGRLNVSLDRDVVRMRGLRVSMEAMERSDVLDPDGGCVRWLKTLEWKVLDLHGEALKSKTDGALRETRVAIAIGRTTELCMQLHEAVAGLRLTIVAHDARAAAALAGSGALVYELTDNQAEQFQECITTEREPTARMREAGRRHSAMVTSN